MNPRRRSCRAKARRPSESRRLCALPPIALQLPAALGGSIERKPLERRGPLKGFPAIPPMQTKRRTFARRFTKGLRTGSRYQGGQGGDSYRKLGGQYGPSRSEFVTSVLSRLAGQAGRLSPSLRAGFRLLAQSLACARWLGRTRPAVGGAGLATRRHATRRQGSNPAARGGQLARRAVGEHPGCG